MSTMATISRLVPPFMHWSGELLILSVFLTLFPYRPVYNSLFMRTTLGALLGTNPYTRIRRRSTQTVGSPPNSPLPTASL